MKIDGIPTRSVAVDPGDGWSVRILDQTKLPWALERLRLTDEDQVAHAIRSRSARNAPAPAEGAEGGEWGRAVPGPEDADQWGRAESGQDDGSMT